MVGDVAQSCRPPLKVSSTSEFARSRAAMPAICQKSALEIAYNQKVYYIANYVLYIIRVAGNYYFRTIAFLPKILDFVEDSQVFQLFLGAHCYPDR